MTNLSPVQKMDGLLKFRLWMYFLGFAHLVIMTIRLLGKDFDHYEDSNVKVYAKFKWKLITTWFNLLFYIYIPISMYCDWRELKGPQSKSVNILNKIRHFTFTNLLLPTTAQTSAVLAFQNFLHLNLLTDDVNFADILFWRLFYQDKTLIFPPSVETVIQLWEHHSMHTVSLLFVIFDLIFVRRERPKSMAQGIIAMLGFISLYVAVCVHSVVNEEYLYPVFKKLPPYKLLVLAIYTYTSLLFYHTGQWFIVDLIHGQRATLKKHV